MSELAAALGAGDLARALELAQQQVRAQPAEGGPRVALSQVLMVLGQWDRALTQLGVLEEMDPALLPYVRTYQAAIHCERLREEVFLGRRSPLVLGEPPAWFAKQQQSNRLLGEDKAEAAAGLRAEALEDAPARAGKLNGEPFEWLADLDSRLGPVFELILDGKYYWVPMERVQRLELSAPADVRDLVWMPVDVTWINGGQKVALMPARYPGSERSANRDIVAGRRTEWEALGAEAFGGQGQRLFGTDSAEYALLDVRSLVFNGEA